MLVGKEPRVIPRSMPPGTEIESRGERGDHPPHTYFDILFGESRPGHLLLPFPHKASNGTTRALIPGVLPDRECILRI